MKTRTILFILFIAFLASGCSRYYYIPPVQQVPLLKGKNDNAITVFKGGYDEANCAGLQGAYALSNSIGISGGYTFFWGGAFKSHQINNNGSGNHFDLALGYYQRIFDNNGVFEVFTGAEHLDQKHQYYDNSYAGKSHISSFKFYVQPAIGFTHNRFEVAFSTRFGLLNFYRVDLIDEGRMEINTITSLSYLAEEYRSPFMVEPAFTIRGGWENVKLQMQYIISTPLVNYNAEVVRNDPMGGPYYFGNSNVSIGLFINLNPKSKAR